MVVEEVFRVIERLKAAGQSILLVEQDFGMAMGVADSRLHHEQGLRGARLRARGADRQREREGPVPRASVPTYEAVSCHRRAGGGAASHPCVGLRGQRMNVSQHTALLVLAVLVVAVVGAGRGVRRGGADHGGSRRVVDRRVAACRPRAASRSSSGSPRGSPASWPTTPSSPRRASSPRSTCLGNQWEGRPLEYLKEDNGSDPVVAVDKARKLVESDNINCMIGPIFSPSAKAVADYLGKSSGIPQMLHRGAADREP